MLTPKQFLSEIEQIVNDNDNEGDRHWAMDDLISDVMAGLGYHEGISVYLAQEKWYE